MPLPLPSLDSRSWAELMREARLLIPRYTDRWTDHNAHDPGITLLELFAWLSEMMLFRLDRASPAAIQSFLKWVDVVLATALPAATGIVFRPVGASGQVVPAGTTVLDAASTLAFSTDQDVAASPAWLELSGSEATRHGILRTQIRGHSQEVVQEIGQLAFTFEPFGSDPRPGDALCLGFDTSLGTAGQPVSLYIWTALWRSDYELARSIEMDWQQAEDTSRGSPASPPGWWQHPAVRTRWEYFSPRGWLPLSFEDETRSLTLTGAVRLGVPADHATGPDGRYWIRCRLVCGAYDCRPRLHGVAINAVAAHHAVTIAGPIALGVSTGWARQRFFLPRTLPGLSNTLQGSVIPGSTRLDVGGDAAWSAAASQIAMGPDSKAYVLDPNSGTIAFGDGRYGAVPPSGAAIRALSYQVGAGTTGNIGSGVLSATLPPQSGLTVVQPMPAAGGNDAESLDRAHGRALDSLAAANRAVTIGDIETLARSVPGLSIARAHAVANHHPWFPCIEVPGAITVVVVPACGDRPRPDNGLLCAIAAYLERCRPLTTEIHVAPPNYVPVTVRARIHVAPGVASGLATAAQHALDSFFHPLHGGHSGTGWPFGRSVYESEVMAVLADLDGVDYVDAIGVVTASGENAVCSSLCLTSTDLVDSQIHRIEIVEGAA